eukprot:8878320-Prorocentrum_lima.AAC.1
MALAAIGARILLGAVSDMLHIHLGAAVHGRHDGMVFFPYVWLQAPYIWVFCCWEKLYIAIIVA